MDSVQVGKAVFVKEKLHNPGNRTQDLPYSGRIGYPNCVSWVKKKKYKFCFCSPESASPEHHIMCAILQLEKLKSKEISQFIHTLQQSQDKIHPEWALTIRIIMLVTIGCKVHLPTTMKLPFFIPLHKCLQHWHLGLLLCGCSQSSFHLVFSQNR